MWKVLHAFGTAAAVTAALACASVVWASLMITDPAGARVVRVDSTGAVETFGPPPGGANLLVRPWDIVAALDGDLDVVDFATDRLVRIDGRTGTQSIVRESDLDPTDVGDVPNSIDVFEDDLGLLHFYVSASDGLHVASEQIGGGFQDA